jgi:hypothetical protein
MTSNRVVFVAEYESGRTVEFSIDRLTLSLGEYAACVIARSDRKKATYLRAASGGI